MVKIPLVPRWNLDGGSLCTPDGGFLYIGARSINFISDGGSTNDYPDIKVFHTRQAIISLDIDPHWGETLGTAEPSRLFVVLSQDNSVQIWDFNKGRAMQGHKVHLACMRYMEGNGPSPQHSGNVFVSFMINRNVLSMDSEDIVVYCVASNSFYRRPMFMSSRHHKISVMKCSPFNENHFAVGTDRGLVLLCDLQKMVTLYTLRGHNTCITSLAWNRFEADEVSSLDENVEAKKSYESPPHMKTQNLTRSDTKNKKTEKLTRSDTKIVESEEIFDIYDYDYLDNEFGATSNTSKSEIASDFVGVEKPNEPSGDAQFDFAEACQSLKEEINALREFKPELSPENVVSLEDCKNAEAHDDTSSCNSELDEAGGENHSKHSSDGSLVRLVCGTPSSEESMDVDGLHRVICQAEVHAALATDTKSTTGNEKGVKLTPSKAAPNENSEQSEVVKTLSSVSEHRNTTLLASVSNDGSLFVWNTDTGGTCDQHKIHSSHIGKSSRMQVGWYNKTSIIIANKAGDLQLWTGEEIEKTNQNKRFKFKECKRQWHQRRVVQFSVCQKRQLLWSITTNRDIMLEDISRNRIKMQYGCVATNILVLRECPDNMNKIAIGLSDRRIGILDISKLSSMLIHIEDYYHRIEAPVSALDWSPDSKRIAYGTTEGRIGIVNIDGGSSSKQQSGTFNSSCGKTIYSISWQGNYLYAVCNECIAVYETNSNQKDALILHGIHGVSTISLHGKYLFVGTNKGKLQLYERKENKSSYFDYRLKVTFDLSHRYISEISWSPIATNIFAVASDSNNIHIIEFLSDKGDMSIKRKLEIKSGKLGNPCVKWSNRNENLLLSCGFDGAIRVWDLSKPENETYIKRFHCPMTCGLFLPTDEEILLCAGKSTSLEFIDMRTEKTEDQETKLKRTNQQVLDNVQWATKATTCLDDKKHNRHIDKKIEKNLKFSENVLNTPTNPLQNPSEQICANGEDVSNLLEKLNIQKEENASNKTSVYMKNPQTLLNLTTKELNKDALEVMHQILTDEILHKSTKNKSLCAKLFGSKNEANQLLTEECTVKNHQTKGISSIFMPQLNTTLKEEILQCIKSKQLCEWHVTLAPSVSYGFWKKCSQAFADQLLEQGYALQSAVYYLAIRKQRDAINVLMQKSYFKEALLIARVYLPNKDPILETIADCWITHLFQEGNLTGAALLCCLSRQKDRAYDCLAKIRNSSPEIERVLRLIKET